MNNQSNQSNTERHSWNRVLFVSFCCGLVLLAVVVSMLYVNDASFLQGYLKRVVTQDSAQLELHFEHLITVSSDQSSIEMEFLIDNISDQEVTGFELVFNDFPEYLEFDSYELADGFDDWIAFKTDSQLVTEFNKTDPRLALYGNTELTNGKFLTLKFNIGIGQFVEPAIVKVSANFANALDTYATTEGTFLLMPASDFDLIAPEQLSLTNTIEIPLKVEGLSMDNGIYGMKLNVENIPDYYELDEVVKADSISSWRVDMNDSVDEEVNNVLILVLADLQSLHPITNPDEEVLNLKYKLKDNATVVPPTEPIMITGSLTDQDGQNYLLPTAIPFQTTVEPPAEADICAKDGNGNISLNEQDSLVAISDLHCMVTDWGKEGVDLKADVYKGDHLNKVNIKDLTVLFSQWSKEPNIESISPQSGPTTTDITLNGDYFYENQPSGVVKAYLKNKVDPTSIHELNIKSISENEMVVNVPTSVPKGDYYMRLVVADELISTVSGFEVD